jgi:hypothetical protein
MIRAVAILFLLVVCSFTAFPQTDIISGSLKDLQRVLPLTLKGIFRWKLFKGMFYCSKW